MKKGLLIALLWATAAVVYAQDMSQITINNVKFEIGANNYQTDYTLIYTTWYKGRLSADNLVVGEDVSWVNNFTKNVKLGEPAEAKLRLFDIELGEVRVLTLGTCELYYSKDTNKLIGFKIDGMSMSSYNRLNVTADVILGDFDPFYRTARPQSLKLNERYEPVNNAKNIVAVYFVQYEPRLTIPGGVYMYAVQIAPDVYKQINDLKQWHKQAQKELPGSYAFSVRDKMTPAQMERNRQLAEQRAEQERKNQETAQQREQQEQERSAQQAKASELMSQVNPLIKEMVLIRESILKSMRTTISKDNFQKVIQCYELLQQARKIETEVESISIGTYIDTHDLRNNMRAAASVFNELWGWLSSSQQRDFRKRFPEYTGR